MPERENERVMRQFIHELWHGRFKREECADVRQVHVQQRGEGVVIARLCGKDEPGVCIIVVC